MTKKYSRLWGHKYVERKSQRTENTKVPVNNVIPNLTPQSEKQIEKEITLEEIKASIQHLEQITKDSQVI